jgi:hypothetical protein
LTAVVILAWFLFFNWKSVHMYFDTDDMYALYFAWSKPFGQVIRENLYLWKGEFRPLGAFFYRGIFALAGFNPLPFRIAALTVCALDLVLCFWFTRLISASDRVAALATLLFAFNVRMIEAWYRTTVIFDVLCFTLAYLAAGIYIAARGKGRDLSAGRIIAIVLIFVCALNAKEFAVCLPVFLVAWEILFNTAKLRDFPRSRAFILIALLGILTVVYAFGKLHGAAAMTVNPAYTPEYSYARFTATWNEYLTDVFILPVHPEGWVSMTILAALLALAAAMRSRVLIFAWIILFFGLLPVSFAPPRGGYEIYFSYIGWTLYAGAFLVALEDLTTRRAPRYRTALACAVFILVGWRWGKLNLHTLRVEDRSWMYDPPAAVRSMADQLRAMYPTLPARSRVLFLEDGFTTGEWTPLFILRLVYKDPQLVVDRVKLKTDKPPGWEQFCTPDRTHYDYVLTWEDGRYRQAPMALAAKYSGPR